MTKQLRKGHVRTSSSKWVSSELKHVELAMTSVSASQNVARRSDQIRKLGTNSVTVLS